MVIQVAAFWRWKWFLPRWRVRRQRKDLYLATSEPPLLRKTWKDLDVMNAINYIKKNMYNIRLSDTNQSRINPISPNPKACDKSRLIVCVRER